jgi:hypothetical protein
LNARLERNLDKDLYHIITDISGPELYSLGHDIRNYVAHEVADKLIELFMVEKSDNLIAEIDISDIISEVNAKIADKLLKALGGTINE